MARKIDEELREERRRQVLDAALGAFQRQGFRGASISDICQAAGMSPGHLYHYFPSKEAIIEAIAERDLQQTLALIETASADPDFVDGLVSAGMEQENAGPAYGLDGPLGAEIVAEAARNPRIAGILRHFRREMGRLLLDAVRAAQASGRLDPRLDPDEAVLLLTLLHEGYSMCRVADPDFHSPRTIELVRAVLRRALSVEADGRTGEAPLP